MTHIRILIVDDEPDIRDLLCKFLSTQGYACRPAADAGEALKAVPDFVPHIILSDINMPGMTGIDLLKAVHLERPQVRVIMLTGFASTENAIDALNHGASAYFKKPLDLMEVGCAIQRIAGEIQEELKEKIRQEDSEKERIRLRASNKVYRHLSNQHQRR